MARIPSPADRVEAGLGSVPPAVSGLGTTGSRTGAVGSMPRREVLGSALRCAVRVTALLARRQLHLHRERLGATVDVDDGRRFVVYRESSCAAPGSGERLTLSMWFRLRWVPPGARRRAFLFERESILNTLLYAGFDGYRTKLWTVDHGTNDYAGFYTWEGRESAERYARYAMRMLRPISVPGSLGCRVDDAAAPSWTLTS